MKAALHELAAGSHLATPASEHRCENAEAFNKTDRVYFELADATPGEAEREIAVLKNLMGREDRRLHICLRVAAAPERLTCMSMAL